MRRSKRGEEEKQERAGEIRAKKRSRSSREERKGEERGEGKKAET